MFLKRCSLFENLRGSWRFRLAIELTGRQVKNIQVHLQTQKNPKPSQLYDFIWIKWRLCLVTGPNGR